MDQFSPAWTTGIATTASPFSGSYNGAGHSIESLIIESNNDEVGLFTALSGATVERLVLQFATISGGKNVGTVAGSASGNSLIRDIEIVGVVTPDAQSTAQSSVGGVVGTARSGSVSFERVVVEVTLDATPAGSSPSYAGGVVGDANGVSISQVQVRQSSISGGTNHWAGGLVGSAIGVTIDNAASTASVNAGPYAGGLVGRAQSTASTIDESYAAGLVSGSGDVGGLIGSADNATVTDSFWDTQATGQSATDGTLVRSSGLATSQMQDYNTYASAGWSIAESFSSSRIWALCLAVNSGYPYLSWPYASNPCSETAASISAMAELTFWLPDGQECSAISPIRVPVGSMFELPGEDALCRTMPGAQVAGWTIPGSVDFTGFGSLTTPFPPGLRVRVVDSQQFTVVPLEPVLSVMFDANVGEGDACVAVEEGRSGDGVREDGRAATVWVPRELISMARFPTEAVCAPIGYELAGWSDADSEYDPGDPMPGDWAESGENRRHLMALWNPA